MRIGVLTGSLSRLAGGTFTSIKRPMQEMARQFPVEIGVFGVEDKFTSFDLPSWRPLAPLSAHGYGPRELAYAPRLSAMVEDFAPDVINVHGIWMYCSAVSLSMFRKHGTRHVVHAHGMLDQWALKKSRWKKRVAGWLYETEHLRTAGCLRALCQSEANSIKKLGLNKHVCVIPNGIDIPVNLERSRHPWARDVDSNRKVLLFLSRIHEKKGLVPLISAWDIVGKRDRSIARDWELVIAGWDNTDHETVLKKLVDELQLTNSVRFVGPLFEDEKTAAFQSADAFVLPSYSEGLPMTVLEAWAFGLPVLMTPECNLPEGFTSEAAIRMETNVSAAVEGLRLLMSMTGAERKAMGARGRALVSERFRWEAIARHMQAVNEWVVGGGSPPEGLV